MVELAVIKGFCRRGCGGRGCFARSLSLENGGVSEEDLGWFSRRCSSGIGGFGGIVGGEGCGVRDGMNMVCCTIDDFACIKAEG